jgi:hypothetical protein
MIACLSAVLHLALFRLSSVSRQTEKDELMSPCFHFMDQRRLFDYNLFDYNLFD